MDDEPPDRLKAAILAILAEADRDLTAEEIATELARRALERTPIVLGSTRERGH